MIIDLLVIVGFIAGFIGTQLLLKYCPRFEAFVMNKIMEPTLGRLLDKMGW